jgi:hypothetical protein
MSEVLNWNSEGTGQTEISKLKESLTVYQKVLGLQVTMKNLVSMALFDAVEQLIQIFLNLHVFKLSASIEQLFEVLIEVLEHKSKLLICVQHVY